MSDQKSTLDQITSLKTFHPRGTVYAYQWFSHMGASLGVVDNGSGTFFPTDGEAPLEEGDWIIWSEGMRQDVLCDRRFRRMYQEDRHD